MKRVWGTALAAVMCLFILGGCAEARTLDVKPTSWVANGSGISAVTQSQEQAVIDGETADVLRIDYTAAANGRNTLQINPRGGINTFAAGPITLWVYGNGCDRNIFLRLVDAAGETFQFYGPKINWSGSWQQVVFSDLSAAAAMSHWGGDDDNIIDGNTKLNMIGVDYFGSSQTDINTLRLAKVEVGLPAGVPETPTAVSGRVVESKSGLICPVENVLVKVTYQPIPGFSFSAWTDAQGNFVLPEVYGDQCELVAFRPDYTTYSADLALSGSPYAVGDILLEKDYIGSEPDTWSVWNTKSSAPLFEVDPVEFHSGTGSVKGTGGAKESWIGTYFIPIDPQAEYELSCWIKSEALSSPLCFNVSLIQITPVVDTSLGWWTGTKELINTGGTEDWTKYTVRLPKPNPSTGRARILLTLVPNVTGTVWIDDLTLRPVPEIVSFQADKSAISASLSQNVQLDFQLTTGSLATLAVYNAQNELLRTLLDQEPIPAKSGSCQWDGKINGEPAPEGTYTLRLTIADGEATATKDLTVEVVNHGPGVTLTYPLPAEGETLKNNRDFINVQGVVQLEPEKTATVSVKRRVNGTEETVTSGVSVQQDGSFSCQAPLSSEAVNELWVVAYDALGNPGEPSDSVFVAYDPAFLFGLVRVENPKIISPQNQQGGKSALRVSLFPSAGTTSRLEIKDAAGQIVFTAEEEFQAVDQELTLTWDGKDQEGAWAADGIYAYTVTVSDEVSAETAVNNTVEVDNTAPIAPLLLYPQAGAKLTNNKPTLQWKAVADAVSYRLTLDGAETWITLSDTSYTLTEPLAEGEHNLKIKAVDKANNESAVTEAAFAVTSLNTDEFSVSNFTAGPNPMNLQGLRSQLAIAFTLRQPAEVRIVIYNLAGSVIKKFDLGSLAGGDQVVVWDGRDAKGRTVAAGPYLLRLEAFNLAAGGEVALSKPILCLR